MCSTVFIFVLALVGVFYPYNRGALFTALVVIYALTSGIAGYTASSFYCQLEGNNWVCLYNRFLFALEYHLMVLFKSETLQSELSCLFSMFTGEESFVDRML